MNQLALPSHLRRYIRLAAGSCFLPVLLMANPASAARRITVEYGLVSRSIPVESLKTYADQGTLTPELRDYVRSLNPTQLRQLQEILRAKVELSPVAVSQFLYTEQGEILLRRLGTVIHTDAGLSGFYAIRASLILAAADPDGLTLLNVLEKFPLQDVKINVGQALRILGDLENLIQESQDTFQEIDRQATLESIASAKGVAPNLPDLRSPGSFTWQKLTIEVNNPHRQRSLPADIYLPETHTHEPVASAPVIVISHGLGSDRTSFAYLAKQLASYGFVVAVPEHPGSDAQRLQTLLSGAVSQLIEPDEFINRPLDVKYLLDELTTLSQSDPRFSGRMNLQDVGVMGQSFGGYTALALAGATFDLKHLASDCANNNSLNPALLLECRVQNMVEPIPDLRDRRVKAVLVVNPIGSSLFGKSGYETISVPIMMVSSSNDTAAPALLEQIRPFTWLKPSDEKYLVLLQGGTHFSTIDTASSGKDVIPLAPSIIGPDPAIAFAYLKTLSVAFAKTYLTNDASYRSYLNAAYTTTISHPAMPIQLVRSLPPLKIDEINR
jgi:predicted dienelactone hydrolase